MIFFIEDYGDMADLMPYAEIEKALDDNDGNAPGVTWGFIQTGVANEIAGLLSPRYRLENVTELHPRLVTAARWLSMEALYLRRGMYGEANPATAKADAERKALREIGSGKVLLDVLSPMPQAPAGTAASATTEELRTKPGGSRLMC